MSFAAAISSGLVNWLRFRGTASRVEYWYFALFIFLLQAVLGVLDSLIAKATASNFSWLEIIGSLLLFVPQLSVSARRFHDAGISAKWLWLNVLPVAAFLFALPEILVFMQKSTVPTDSEMVKLAAASGPFVILTLVVGLVTLVFSLLPTKTYLQGNRFATAESGDISMDELRNQGW